ncbi:MAG: electron transport complex subunit E [Clostridiales bacterium]|jgi:electron transport complex protein RnfE|nr:electron transport complex subunit E [Clostridiales bacterium]
MAKNNQLRGVFVNGIFNENPVFRLVLGACPIIAVTTSVSNGIGMGLAATLVLLGSNLVISALRNFIPNKVRIPAYMVVISTFVTIIQLLMQAFVPSLYEALGIFLPLIVVNCIILARAEAFAGKNAVMPSIADGIGMGIGFTLALVMIAAVREFFGTGSIMGFQLMGASFEPVLLFILAPGGFLVFGLLLGIINAIADKRKASKANKEVKAA